jgi:hypothetical protein
MRSILRATKNVVEQNSTKALAPAGVLRNPEPPNGGGAVTVCYVKWWRTLFFGLSISIFPLCFLNLILKIFAQ